MHPTIWVPSLPFVGISFQHAIGLSQHLAAAPTDRIVKGVYMTHTTAIHVDAELERTAPLRTETHEVRYLDMSGDGLPDAVEYVDRRLFRRRVRLAQHRRREAATLVRDWDRWQAGGVAEREAVFVRDNAGRLRQVTVSDC